MPRPVRNLAAFNTGYSDDDNLEVDVWTVNATTGGTVDPEDLDGGGNVAEVIRQAGNVVEVAYKGIGTTGYRYVDMEQTNPGKESPADATQQAFAGAVRIEGGKRDPETGRAEPGDVEALVRGPDFGAVVEHARTEILPVVIAHFRELGQALTLDDRRSEREEPVASEPIDGFENEVRVILNRPGEPEGIYEVRNNDLITVESPYE